MEPPAAILLVLTAASMCTGLQPIKRLTGSNVTFTAELGARHTEINWYRGKSKIVDLEEGKEPDFYSLQDRVTADLTEATLTLRGVTPADSGEYKAELLVGGQLSPVFFHLQVLDHVCQVAINTTTEGSNVTLHCICSGRGAPPSQYQWSSGDRPVSDMQNITVEKRQEEQEYRCVARNDVSSNIATYMVPVLPPELGPSPAMKILIIGICVVLLICIIVVCFYKNNRDFSSRVDQILMCYRCRKKAPDLEDKENSGAVRLKDEENSVAPNPEDEKMPLMEDDQQPVAPGLKVEEKPPMEAIEQTKSPCCCVNLKLPFEKATKIILKKDKNVLMKITQHSQLLDLKRCIVQRGGMKIKDVKDGDYGTYTAEVHPSIGGRNTMTFRARDLPKKLENKPSNDESGKEVVCPVGEELSLEIPNAETITWRKEKDELLTVTCDPDPLLERMALHEGNLRLALASGDDGVYGADIIRSADSPLNQSFKINVNDVPGKQKRETRIKIESLPPAAVTAPAFGDITFYPEIKGKAEKITWKKEDKIVAQWKKEEPRQMEAALDPESGNSDHAPGKPTNHIQKEEDKEKYILNPAPGNQKPAPGNPDPAPGNQKPAPGNPKPASVNQEPAGSGNPTNHIQKEEDQEKYILDPASGNLTNHNLNEEDQGRYIMEAQCADQTILPWIVTLSLSYSKQTPKGGRPETPPTAAHTMEAEADPQDS